MRIQTNSPLVQISKLSLELGGTTILDKVDACIPKGSATAIVGPNGAGKSSLILCLLGEYTYRGMIEYPLEHRPPKIGYVPQRLQFDRGFPLTVLEFLVMGVQRLPLWLGVQNRYKDKAMSLLKLVKAEKLAKQQLGNLSGGELQRILLALALQQEPELLLLDEPAAGVDSHGEMIFCELLEQLREERGYTQLMVSHDLGTVSHHATHVIGLNREVKAEGSPAKVLQPEVLSHVFGIHMGALVPGGEKYICSHPINSQNKLKENQREEF